MKTKLIALLALSFIAQAKIETHASPKGFAGQAANLYVDTTSQFTKKSNVPETVRKFIENKLDLKLAEHDILADISVCNCSCHELRTCPAFPRYLPISLLLEKNADGSFKRDKTGALLFKSENSLITLAKATLCLKHVGDEKLHDALQRMYNAFKKQNATYAELFENKKSTAVLLAKINSIKQAEK